jgi:hypothetical protein
MAEKSFHPITESVNDTLMSKDENDEMMSNVILKVLNDINKPATEPIITKCVKLCYSVLYNITAMDMVRDNTIVAQFINDELHVRKPTDENSIDEDAKQRALVMMEKDIDNLIQKYFDYLATIDVHLTDIQAHKAQFSKLTN